MSTQSRAGVYFAVLQLLFALGWTVYVIYLPALAAKAGIPTSAVIWILMADQAIFALMDLAMGVAADRVAAAYARLARILVMMTLVSCAAFLLLPFVVSTTATADGAAPGAWVVPVFIGLTLVWTVTSSALRTPPMVLIGRYAALPQQPWLSSFYLFGLGVAGAIAPFLTVWLRGVQPELPFVVASLSLAVVALGLAWAGRNLATSAPADAGAAANSAANQATTPRPSPAAIALFLLGALLAAIGFQLHFSLNTAPQFLKFAKPADLEYLMPLFWVGFNIAIFPAGALAARVGTITMLIAGGVIGAVALAVGAQAGSLQVLAGAQIVSGAAWSALLMSAMSAALAMGHTGREGKVNGGLFGLLAVATFARMGMVAAQLHQGTLSPLLPGIAIAAWALAALAFVCAWLALGNLRSTAPGLALRGPR